MKRFKSRLGINTSFSREHKLPIVHQKLERIFQPDEGAFKTFNLLCPEWLPSDLHDSIREFLGGLNPVMATVVVNNLCDCLSGTRLCLTDLDYIDQVLCDLYFQILGYAEKEGLTLEPAF